MRMSIRNGAAVGIIDSVNDIVLSGDRATENHVSAGSISRSMAGVIMFCASLRSLHAAPMAMNTEPKMKRARTRKRRNQPKAAGVIASP